MNRIEQSDYIRKIIREELEVLLKKQMKEISAVLKGKTDDDRECIICYEGEDYTNYCINNDNGQEYEGGTYNKVFKAKNGKYFYSD